MEMEALYFGEVAEWFMAEVLKISDSKGSVGSNPTLSFEGSKFDPQQSIGRFG